VQSAPPGIMLSPFFEDWSLPTLMASATDVGDRRTGASAAGVGVPVIDANRTTVAMLLSQDAAGIGESSQSWILYLECASANPSTPSEEVLISLSGSGGQSILRAFSDGRVVTAQGESKTVPSEHEAAVWKAWIPLPAAIIGEGSWIRLGLCRVDAAGARSAWPRPMFPWEDLPPHAAIDLRPWSGMPHNTP
jgi:hypothetical protein